MAPVQRTIVYTERHIEKCRVMDALALAAPITYMKPLIYIDEKEETFPTPPLIREYGRGDCDCACIMYAGYLYGKHRVRSFAIPCIHHGQLHVVLGVPAWGIIIDPSYLVFKNYRYRRHPVIRRL